MSLFPEEDIVTKEIESWKVFVDSLKSEEDKKLILEMLEKCQKYALATNAKGKPFPTEPLIMALLFPIGLSKYVSESPTNITSFGE